MTPGSANLLLAGGLDQYQISRSLRLRSSASAYLSRTPSTAGNKKTFTWSGWVKRGSLTNYMELFDARSTNTEQTGLLFSNDDTLLFRMETGGTAYDLRTTQVFRDASAWYHIVLAVDTTQVTASNRTKIYVNGVQVTSFVSASYYTQNADTYINSTIAHDIGRFGSGANYFDGYLTEINFIDGQALTPASFGQTDAVTNVWGPKKYTGTYGTNGFYLNFADNSAPTAAAIGKDSSGNNNNWTPNNINITSGASTYSGYFNGSAYVEAPSSGNLQLGSGDWTVEMWVKKTGGPTQQCLFGYDGNDPYFEFDASKFRMIIGGVDRSGTTTIVDNVWYHVAWVRVSGQIRIYVNGTLEVSATSSGNLTGSQPRIGMRRDDTTPFTGYLSNVRMVKGTAVYTSNFTPPTSPLTAISGTQLLTLKSATIIDNSANNFSLTNSATTVSSSQQPFAVTPSYDSMIDTPTSYDDGGNGRGNYATFNSLNGALGTYSDGNLTWVSPTTDQRSSGSTIAVSSFAKSYCEITIGSSAGGQWQCAFQTYPQTWNPRVGYRSDGQININGTVQGTYATYTVGDVIGFTYDSSTRTCNFYKNGTKQGGDYTFPDSTVPVYMSAQSDGSGIAHTYYFNAGQRPFAYTPPTGYKALNTQNLPTPTIITSNKWFDISLWNGTGANQVITNSGGFQPDLIWDKSRSSAGLTHILTDSVRGVNAQIFSPLTNAEESRTDRVQSFNSNGFTVGSYTDVNQSGQSFVGWQWKKGATPGFDIITYTGNGVNARTISHSLGVAPKMIIVKSRSTTYSWYTYHASLGATQYIFLNLTNAAATGGQWFNSAPTSSIFYLGGTGNEVNENGQTYVAYLFADVPGFSKFGSYTGNGLDDGPFIYCDFRPRYVLFKRTSTTGNWYIYDSSRNTTNVVQLELYPDASAAETNGGNTIDLLSNGFKLRTGSQAPKNGSGNTFIYAAFAENPFKYALAR